MRALFVSRLRRTRLRRAILAVLLIGLAIRVAAGASSGLFLDEIYSRHLALAPVADVLAHGRVEPLPPAWYLALKPLAAVTADPLVLRLPSLLLGLAGAALTFLAGRRVVGDRAALAAAALLAVAYPVWLADSQVRMYGAAAFLNTAAFALWLRRGPFGWYAAVCVLLPLVHYVGNLTLAILAVASRGRPMAPPLLGLATGAAWLAFAFSGSEAPLQSTHAPPFVWSLYTLPSYLLGAVLPLAWWHVGEGTAVAWTAGLASLLGWVLLGRGLAVAWREDRPAAAVLAALVAVPALALFAGAWLGFQMFQHRYLVPFAFAFYLIMAAGALAWRAGSVLALALAVNAITACLFPGDPYLWNQDWARAADFVRERPGDGVVVAHIPFALLGFNEYYAPGRFRVDFSQGGPRFDFSGYEGPPQVGLYGPEALERGLQDFLRGKRVFLIVNQPAGSLPAILEWFGTRYRPEAELEIPSLHDWGRISVLELEPQ